MNNKRNPKVPLHFVVFLHTYFGMSIGVILTSDSQIGDTLWVYLLTFLEDNLTENSLVFWTLESFYSVFHNVPWALDAGRNLEMYPFGLGFITAF